MTILDKVFGLKKKLLTPAILKNMQSKNAAQIALQQDQIQSLQKQVAHLEDRLLSYYKNRWDVIDKLADYLVGTEIDGDYLEFGVFMGKTFGYSYQVMSPLFPNMKFVALDSFSGLPEPTGIDKAENYTSGFYEGQFACDISQFRKNMTNYGVSFDRLTIVEGWFDETLKKNSIQTKDIGKVAAAWIDCDLYASTVPVLDFLVGRLSVGSVLLFDDWRCYRNLADFGQQRACREWLDKNSQIELNEFVDFGFHGQAFTVAKC